MNPRVRELDRLLVQAQDAPQLWLPKLDTHPLGAWLGVAGLALGVWSVESTATWRLAAGWLAMGLVVAGMVVHAWMLSRHDGWLIDFATRTVQPKAGGAVVPLEGVGWSVACVPGDRRAAVVIDLRHTDIGRVARLFEPAGRGNGALQRRLSALADVLAERLAVERGGTRL